MNKIDRWVMYTYTLMVIALSVWLRPEWTAVYLVGAGYIVLEVLYFIFDQFELNTEMIS